MSELTRTGTPRKRGPGAGRPSLTGEALEVHSFRITGPHWRALKATGDASAALRELLDQHLEVGDATETD